MGPKIVMLHTCVGFDSSSFTQRFGSFQSLHVARNYPSFHFKTPPNCAFSICTANEVCEKHIVTQSKASYSLPASAATLINIRNARRHFEKLERVDGPKHSLHMRMRQTASMESVSVWTSPHVSLICLNCFFKSVYICLAHHGDGGKSLLKLSSFKAYKIHEMSKIKGKNCVLNI